MMDLSKRIGGYQATREGLERLLHFARAMEQQIGQAGCEGALPEFEVHISDITFLLDHLCDRCGAQLTQDVLGIEGYTVGAFKHACVNCYEVVQPSFTIYRRYARLVVFAAERPDLMVGRLVQMQRQHRLADYALEDALNVDGVGLLRLALSPMPRHEYLDEDIAAITAYVGCAIETVQRLVFESVQPDLSPESVWPPTLESMISPAEAPF